MKVTKKKIREVLKDARKRHPLGWKLCDVTAYIYQNEVGYFIHYHGQGIYDFLTNFNISKTISLKDLTCKDEWTLKEATEIAYERVVEMVEHYEEWCTEELKK